MRAALAAVTRVAHLDDYKFQSQTVCGLMNHTVALSVRSTGDVLGFHNSGYVGLARIASTAKTALTAILKLDMGRLIFLWLENCSAAWVNTYRLVGTEATHLRRAKPWERRCMDKVNAQEILPLVPTSLALEKCVYVELEVDEGLMLPGLKQSADHNIYICLNRCTRLSPRVKF